MPIPGADLISAQIWDPSSTQESLSWQGQSCISQNNSMPTSIFGGKWGLNGTLHPESFATGDTTLHWQGGRGSQQHIRRPILLPDPHSNNWNPCCYNRCCSSSSCCWMEETWASKTPLPSQLLPTIPFHPFHTGQHNSPLTLYLCLRSWKIWLFLLQTF